MRIISTLLALLFTIIMFISIKNEKIKLRYCCLSIAFFIAKYKLLAFENDTPLCEAQPLKGQNDTGRTPTGASDFFLVKKRYKYLFCDQLSILDIIIRFIPNLGVS